MEKLSYLNREFPVLSKSIFDGKNQFFKKTNIQEYQFRRPFLVKTFFVDSIFGTLYFLKLCPIFDELIFLVGIKNFPWEYVESWPKFYFLGPTIFEIPQPN